MIGRRHIEEIQKNRFAQLASIVDPSPKTADLAKKENVLLYSSLADMVASDRPDGVVLSTPNRLHVEQALQCVGWNLRMLVEKPLAHTVEEGQCLVDAAERAHAQCNALGYRAIDSANPSCRVALQHWRVSHKKHATRELHV